jgi:hypothetical protein
VKKYLLPKTDKGDYIASPIVESGIKHQKSKSNHNSQGLNVTIISSVICFLVDNSCLGHKILYTK